MKMMAGALVRACSNRSRTRAAPTPTNISTNSEPLIEKNGTLASPATAAPAASCRCRAGRPAARPSACARRAGCSCSGSFRKSTISCSSSLASSTPATSSKRTLGIGLDVDLGLALADRHQAAAQPLRRQAPDRNIQTPKNSAAGNDPGEQIAQQRALDLPGIGHAVFLQVGGKSRIDAGGRRIRSCRPAAVP